MKTVLEDIVPLQAVWWVDEKTYEQVSLLDLWRDGAPVYVGEQFSDAEGRAGRGRLWVDARFGDASISWPNNHPNSEICGKRAGIVLTWEDATYVLATCKACTYVPLITDDKLDTWYQCDWAKA